MTEDRSEMDHIVLPGSEGYWDAWDTGNRLDDLFPGQDASDFACGCQENSWGPLGEGPKDLGIAGLLMVQLGANDERDWQWLVRLTDGSHWWVVGGCCYTGWDCRSEIEWTPFS